MKKKHYIPATVFAVLSACLLLAGCAQEIGSAPATNTPATVTPSVGSLPSISEDESSDDYEDEYSDDYEGETSDDYEDEPTPAPPPISETNALKTFKEDIDGDGGSETVSVAEQTVGDPEEYDFNIFIYIQDGADIKGTYVDCPIGFDSAYMTKTDSGSACLVVSLEYEDAYNNTFFFSFGDSAAVPESILPGCALEVKGTEIKIEDWGDALGSWDYYQKFKLGDDFSLTATTEMMIMTGGEKKSLHTIKKLPVWMLVDGIYKKTFVKAGEDIIPISTDCRNYLKFKLKDGSEGRINYTRGAEYDDFLIDGLNEEEYFDNIEYWG